MPSGDPTYTGRPDIPGLTAIALRVAVAMRSGMVPLPVHATALESRWTGPTTGNSYEDPEITWDFGDPGSTRTMINPTTGETVSTNSDQTGPEAVHLYDSPGEYTITATARGWNGTAFVTATTSTVVQVASVRVQAFSATQGTYTLKVQEAEHARAARIDGSRSLFLIRPAGHAIVPGAAGFGFSGWYRFRAANVGGTVASYHALANGKKSWYLTQSSIGAVTCQVGDATSGVVNAVTAASYNDTSWHHVAAWCDVASGVVQLEVDGVAGTAGSRAPGLAMRAPADVPFAVGASFASTLVRGTPSAIDADEFAVWGRPTTSGERAWLYNSGAGRHWDDVAASSPPAGLTTGMLAWWTFDAKRGPTWADSTGNGHALQDYGTSRQYPGVAGVTPKCYRPGGTATAPIAHDADVHAIRAAVALAAGLDADDVYDSRYTGIKFGGSLAGQPWTLAPGTTADGFDGRVDCLGHEDADAGPGVTATAWDTARCPEVYFDSTAAVDGDGTEASPYNSPASLATVLNNRYPSTPTKAHKVRIKAGSDFAITARISMWCVAPTLIQKWGAGAKFTIRNTNAAAPQSLGVFGLNNDSGYAVDRFLVDGGRLIGEGSVVFTTMTDPTTEIPPHGSGQHLLDVDVETSYAESTKVILGSQTLDNVGWWGGSISGGGGLPPTSVKTTGLDRIQNVGIDSGSFGSIVGVIASGGGGGTGSNANTFAHHFYWGVGSHSSLARWVECRPTEPYASPDASGYTHHEMNLSFKGSVDGTATEAPRLRRGFVLDQCVLTGTQNGAGFGRQNTTALDGNAFDRLVISGNRCFKSTVAGNQYLGLFVTDSASTTFRDNRTWKNEGISSRPNTATYTGHLKIYRNRAHCGADLAINSTIAAFPQAFELRHLLSLEMTDNVAVFRGAKSVAGNRRGVVRLTSWDDTEALAYVLIDRNQYFYPDVADGEAFVERGTPETTNTFTAWQARGWDPNGVIADPLWPDAPNGDFGDDVVGPEDPADPTVESVTINPSTATVAGGSTRQFTATVSGTDSPSQAVTWTATLGSISSAGLLTAPSATLSVQTITITAASVLDPTKSDTAAATVPASDPDPGPEAGDYVGLQITRAGGLATVLRWQTA